MQCIHLGLVDATLVANNRTPAPALSTSNTATPQQQITPRQRVTPRPQVTPAPQVTPGHQVTPASQVTPAPHVFTRPRVVSGTPAMPPPPLRSALKK